jgi:hypothetical protein
MSDTLTESTGMEYLILPRSSSALRSPGFLEHMMSELSKKRHGDDTKVRSVYIFDSPEQARDLLKVIECDSEESDALIDWMTPEDVLVLAVSRIPA